jgi:NDP-sugar pyrophosphorylase family protein
MMVLTKAVKSQAITPGLTAVILVGGFGNRIRHITGVLPKPMVKVYGKPFLHWIFKNLKTRGVHNVYLLTHFEADQIENYAREEESGNFRIHCVKENTPSGTGGAVLDFLAKVRTPSNTFLLLNGDSLLMEYSLKSALNSIVDGSEGVLFGVSMNDASRYGTLKFNGSGRLLAFKEKAPGAGVINTGTYLFTRQAFAQITNQVRPLSLELDVIPAMVECGVKIKVVVTSTPFIDIGTEASLADAETFVRDNFASK